MNPSIPNELADALQGTNEILDRIDAGAKRHKQEDRLLNHDLDILIPYLSDPEAPDDLVRTAARLYFALERYQEAAELLRRLQDPGLNGIRVRADFHNGYYTPSRDWVSREDEIWQAFRDKVPTLMDDDTTDDDANRELHAAWDHLFPTDLMQFTYLTYAFEGLYGALTLGNPHGFYSLFPMSHLIQHRPKELARDWFLSTDAEEISDGGIGIGGKEIALRDIVVRITQAPGFHVGPMVDLTLWHPMLHALIREDEKYGTRIMHALLFMALPHAAAYLNVDAITVSEAPFGDEEETTPLLMLGRWLQKHGMDPDIPLHLALHNRVYFFTREPVSASRPRGDISRGATCMPELEEIYFLRNSRGLAALQRYGVGYWFLIVPRSVCGEDFPAFRDSLIRAVQDAEGDTVCFTGWAEGTCNCYLDFLSLSSRSALHALQQYLASQSGGDQIRIASFYWNSVPRTADCARERTQQAQFEERMKQHPDDVAPPQEQVSPQVRAKLEQAFRETRWEKPTQARKKR